MELREIEDDTSRRTAARLVLGAAAVVFVLLAVVGVVLLRTAGDETGGTTWDDYTVTPTGLEIHTTRSGCERVSEVEVDEADDRVDVTLHLKVVAPMCDAMLHEVTEAVTLEAPLGSRPVRDGACLAQDSTDGKCQRSEAQTAPE